MGVNRICQTCGHSIKDPPTLREDLYDGQYCDLGHKQDQMFTVEQWLIALADEVMELKEALTGGRGGDASSQG